MELLGVTVMTFGWCMSSFPSKQGLEGIQNGKADLLCPSLAARGTWNISFLSRRKIHTQSILLDFFEESHHAR